MEVAQMILIDVSGASATVWKQDILTSGMVGAITVFRFDEAWDTLAKTAVFRAGEVTIDAIVADSMSVIPHEVLAVPGIPLEIGVYGTSGNGTVVIPTVWASTKPIKPGADPSGDESLDPSLPVWGQMQEQLNDMYRSSEEIKAAKEEMLQAVEDGKEEIRAVVEAGGYYTKNESGNNFASAVKGKLSGVIVAANDISPVEHTVAVKVHGKNLFNTIDDFAQTSETNYTFENGVLNIVGSYANKWLEIEEGKTYTFSAISTRVGETGGGIYIRTYTEDKLGYTNVLYDTVNLSPRVTFTAEKGHTYLRVTFYGSTKSNAEESATYSNIQLEEGAVATEYEPYLDLSTVTVSRYGKNLIEHPFYYNARTINGVTFTPRADGTVAVSGTATANTYFALNGGFAVEAAPIPSTLKVGKEYTISDAMLFLYTADGETKAFNEGTFTMPEGYEYYGIFVYVPSGATMSAILGPQLEAGTSHTEFESYTKTSYAVLSDGTADGVLSLAPSMTLLADNAGVILDVVYNRDTNSVIAELLRKYASPARISHVDLLASKWVGDNNLYSQVVSIDGATEYSQVDLTPDVEQLAIFYEKDLAFVTENEDGVVTVYAIGQKPENDYTIQVTITEVNV